MVFRTTLPVLQKHSFSGLLTFISKRTWDCTVSWFQRPLSIQSCHSPHRCWLVSSTGWSKLLRSFWTAISAILPSGYSGRISWEWVGWVGCRRVENVSWVSSFWSYLTGKPSQLELHSISCPTFPLGEMAVLTFILAWYNKKCLCK